MNAVMDYFRNNYYIGLLAHLFAIVAIFIVRRQKRRELKIFELYLLVYIFNELPFYIATALFQSVNRTILFISGLEDYLFTVFEFFVFYVYIYKALEGTNRSVIRLLSLVYYLTSAVVFLKVLIVDRFSLEVLQNAFILQAILLLFLCVLYFLKIFNSKPTLDLINEPSFWIITGLTCCLLCTFPLTLLLNNIFQKNYLLYSHLFSIFYFFYVILFIMIIRASLCKNSIAV